MDETGLRAPLVQANLEEDDPTNPLSADVIALDQGTMSQSDYATARKYYLIFLSAQHFYDQYIRQNLGVRRRVILHARAQQLHQNKASQKPSSHLFNHINAAQLQDDDYNVDNASAVDGEDNGSVFMEHQPLPSETSTVNLTTESELGSAHAGGSGIDASHSVEAENNHGLADQRQELNEDDESKDPRSSQFLLSLKKLTSKFPPPSLSQPRDPPIPILNENIDPSTSPKRTTKQKKKAN